MPTLLRTEIMAPQGRASPGGFPSFQEPEVEVPFPDSAPGYERPPKDQMEQGMVEGLKQMLEKIAEGGWGQQHSVWILYRDELAPRNPLGIQAFVLQFKCLHILTPEQMAMERNWLILLGLAEALSGSSLAQRLVPENLIGWAFAYEAWGACANKQDPQSMASVDRDAKNRRLHKRRDRFEMRAIAAVDRTERTYTVMQLGSDGDLTVRVTDPEEDTGAIEHALVELIRSC